MGYLISWIAGIATGLYLAAQQKALHMPVFTLPKHIDIDPLAVVLAAIFAAAIWNMRGKRTGGRRGR